MALVLVLFLRTNTAEVKGAVTRPPSDGRPGDPAYTPAPPGTLPVWIALPFGHDVSAVERELNAGISCSETGREDGEPATTVHCGYQLPETAAKEARPGDHFIMRAKRIEVPGFDSLRVQYMTYQFRRSGAVQTFGAPENTRFIVFCGLFTGAPLILWGIATVVISIGAAIRPPSQR